MHEVEIKHTKQGCGFVKATTTTLAGVTFDNGKIAYLNADGAVCAGDDEAALAKALKQEAGTVSVQVVRKG